MLETVIALAVLSLGALLVLGRAGRAVDQIELHTAFQDLRTGVAEARLEAFASETPRVLDPHATKLPQGWELRSPAPVTITPSGDCGPMSAELLRRGVVRASLITNGRGCTFLRER